MYKCPLPLVLRVLPLKQKTAEIPKQRISLPDITKGLQIGKYLNYQIASCLTTVFAAADKMLFAAVWIFTVLILTFLVQNCNIFTIFFMFK